MTMTHPTYRTADIACCCTASPRPGHMFSDRRLPEKLGQFKRAPSTLRRRCVSWPDESGLLICVKSPRCRVNCKTCDTILVLRWSWAFPVTNLRRELEAFCDIICDRCHVRPLSGRWIGYAPGIHQGQDLAQQHATLSAAGCGHGFEEKVTTQSATAPSWVGYSTICVLEGIASAVMQTTLRVNGRETVIMPPSCPARD